MERRATEPRKRRLILAGVVTVTLLSPLAAVAQHTASSEGGTPRSVVTLADVHRYPALDLNLPPVFSKGTHQSSVLDRAPRSLSQSNPTSDRRSKTRAFLGAVVGATGGFFAGGYTGA